MGGIKLCGLAVMWLLVGAAHAQTADTAKTAAPDPASLTPAAVDAGRKIFHGPGTCFACHGAHLQGGPLAPALTGKNWRHIDGTFAGIVNRISNGQPGTLMPRRPGGITEAQIPLVAAYVYAVSHGRAEP